MKPRNVNTLNTKNQIFATVLQMASLQQCVECWFETQLLYLVEMSIISLTHNGKIA